MRQPLNIEVKDTVFDPNDKDKVPKVHVRKTNGNHLYKVWLYLTGHDLPYVESVTYVLHTTFSDPVQRVRRSVSNPNCQFVLWTWGVFEVKVRIMDKSNRHYEISHHLSYDKQLQQKEIKYIFE